MIANSFIAAGDNRPMPSPASAEIAATAARLVVTQGMEYGAAKRQAAKLLGHRGALPDNDALEEEVRDYLALFCADTQPQELAALRQVALRWMDRLCDLNPYITGAVWRGTATAHSAVHLLLFCEDGKQAEITLLNLGLDYEVGQGSAPSGAPVDALVLNHHCATLGEGVRVVLHVCDWDDLRGALKRDAKGHSPLGDAKALQALVEQA